MNIKGLKVSKIQLLVILFLVAGLLFSLSLVQESQTSKSRADEGIYNSLDVSGANCNSPENGQSDCQLDENTTSVTINGLQRLKELPPP